jgi:hypothetical protein
LKLKTGVVNDLPLIDTCAPRSSSGYVRRPVVLRRQEAAALIAAAALSHRAP